jgi:mono/diheme cytochrome c family protein
MKLFSIHLLTALLGCAAVMTTASARADDSHGLDDALSAEAQAMAPQFIVPTAPPPPATARITVGQWGSVIPWTPHIPVTAATLPDGRLLTFASNQRTTFPAANEFTYAAVWDPATGVFTEINNNRHDMFCGGTSMLPDGRVVVNGGRNNTRLSSVFDWRTNQWSAIQNMNDGRWYNTSVALTDGSVFTVTGDGGNYTAERWTATNGWVRFTGINWGPLAVDQPGYVTSWHPMMLLAPDGRLFHGGPTRKMNWVTTSGAGSITFSGVNVPGTLYPKEGCFAMYDEGRILVAGGAASPSVSPSGDGTTGVSTNKAFTIDIRGSTPVVANTGSMKYVRQFVNSVILPNGEVLAIGGNSTGLKFNDTGSILTPEIWNPATGKWRSVADISVPRNYHSLALLLPDGRVWSGGGGLSGNSADHRDAQIYTPPVLFNADGTAATRPVITQGPSSIGLGAHFVVQATEGLTKFSFIKMSSQTHSMNTDLRYLNLPFIETTAGTYELTAHTSANVMSPGYWMLFGLKANGTYSAAKVIQVTTTPTPAIGNPGAQTSIVGEAVSLPIQFTNTTGNPLTFTATGLPPGLTISATSGVISGIANAAANTNVLVSVGGTQISFKWVVSAVLTLTPIQGAPQPQGIAITYIASSTGGVNPRYKWDFGDGTAATTYSATASISHNFPGPGRYIVTITATDDNGHVAVTSFRQAIHAPLTAKKPTASSSIAFETRPVGSGRIWVVNPDNNSVTVFEAWTKAKLAETTVGATPRSVAVAPDGRVWVVNTESASISILNAGTFGVVQTLPLARGSRPFGLAFDPNGTAAYVALEASGQLLKLHPGTGAQLAVANVGVDARHVSVSADGARVYVNRFITPPLPGEGTAAVNTAGRGGEVVVLTSSTLAIQRTLILQHSEAIESEKSGRGIPNYLAATAISPDGLSAWVPSKQDNIKRGSFRNGQPLTHDKTVRAIASRINLTTQAEDYAKRLDFDNAGMPSAAVFDPWGMYVFVALESSRAVAVVDAWAGRELLRFNVGRAPQGLTLSPDGGTLYVHNFMDRKMTVHDVRGIINGGELQPGTAAILNCITTEKLTAQVLLGKQLFYDAVDTRLALEQYVSCAACHNDGGQDGRVWDLTNFGEGLRNTITLRGHGNQGALHWSGNFDEVQDFEGQIRNLAGGTGLMSDAQFNTGTRNQPLGTAKAGVSGDLDALAAYVKSLTASPISPFRTTDGNLTSNATAGQQIFRNQNCASCHGGANFSNSALNVFRDIGTIKPGSGKRLGAALTGLDVPTLRGLWATAPYLHDGSAATLTDAVKAHASVTLNSSDMEKLVDYLQQLDNAPAAAPQPVTVVLSTSASNVSGQFTVNAVFSEVVTGLTAADIAITGGTVKSIAGSGLSYTLTITPTANVAIALPANAAQDSTGLGNLASNALTISFRQAPTITLTTPSNSVTAAFQVTLTTSETLSGATASDVQVTNGVVSGFSAIATGFKFSVQPTNAGTVSVAIPAGVMTNSGGTGNAASNILTVTYGPPTTDPRPTMILTTANSTVQGAFDVAVVTSETLYGAEESDLILTNGTLTGAWTTANGFSVSIRPTVAGAVTMRVPEGAMNNLAGISNAASNTLTVTYSPGGVGSSLSGPGVDADLNGNDVSDLIENALDNDQAHDGGWKLVAAANGQVDAELVRPSADRDVTFTLETSAEMQNWQALELAPASVDLGSGWERLAWQNVGHAGQNGMVRLRATHANGTSVATPPQTWQRISLIPGAQTVGINLINPPLYAGYVAELTDAASLRVDEAPALSDGVDAQATYYLEVRDGAHAGERYDVAGISGDVVTLALNSPNNTLAHIAADLAGARVTIRPHITLSQVFPKELLPGNKDVNKADQVLFYAGNGWAPHGLLKNGTVQKWVAVGDTTLASADDKIILPGTGVMVQMVSAARTYVLTGHVRTNVFVRLLKSGHNLLAMPWPLNGTPASLGLTQANGFSCGATASAADQIQLWTGDATPGSNKYSVYWLHAGGGSIASCWTPSASATVQSVDESLLLPAGRAFFFKAQAATANQGWLLDPPHLSQ